MVTMLVSMDKAGRIVIPKEIREQLDFQPYTELTINVEGGSIRIDRVDSPRRVLQITDDGRPYFEAVATRSLTDLDIQRLRDADQR